jgi:hypothetical protein
MFGQDGLRHPATPGVRKPGISLLITLSFVELVKQRQALPASHQSAAIRGNSFHLGPMGSFFIARIAQNHTVIIECVHVAFRSFVIVNHFGSLKPLQRAL